MPLVAIPELGTVQFADDLNETQLAAQVTAAVAQFHTQQRGEERARLEATSPFTRYTRPDLYPETAPGSLEPVLSEPARQAPAATRPAGSARPWENTDLLKQVNPEDPGWSPALRGALKLLHFDPPPGLPAPELTPADRQAIADQLQYENSLRAEAGSRDLAALQPVPGVRFGFELSPAEAAALRTASPGLQKLTGWAQTVGGFLDFLNSYEGVVTGTMAASAGGVGVATRLAFGADMLHGAFQAKDELAAELAKPAADRDQVKIGQLESALGLSALMAGSLIGRETGRGLGKVLPESSRLNQPVALPRPDFQAWLDKLRPTVQTKTSTPYVRRPMPADGGASVPANPSATEPRPQMAVGRPAGPGEVRVTDETVFAEALARQQAQLEALQQAMAERGGATVPAEPGATGGPPPPIPEAPASIKLQLADLKQGKRKALLLTVGETLPEVPPGMETIKTGVGTFLFDPARIKPEEIGQAVDAGRVGEVLDYGIAAKPEPGTEIGAVTVRDPQGVEKRAVVTDAENLPNVVDAAKQAAEPADTIALETPQQVIEQRLSSTPEATPTENVPAATVAPSRGAEPGAPDSATPPAQSTPGRGETLVTDPARRQEILNSIAEGELILKSGRSNAGKKLSKPQLEAVRRSVESARAKLSPPEAPAQGGDVRSSEQRTAPQAGPTITPPKTEPVKRVARGLRARKVFDAETELQGADILSWINENMRMLSKSEAHRTLGKEWWQRNQSLYDDAAPLQRPHHNVIYGGKSRPDQVAQAAYDAGILKAPDVPELWAAIRRASNARAKAFANARREQQHLEEQAREFSAWQKATAAGEQRVAADDLRVGDVLDVEGERTEVTHVDPDTGDVTLKDGPKFGIQKLASGEVIYVEKFDHLDDPADWLPEEDQPAQPLPQVPAEARNLSRKEQREFEELSLKAKAAREAGGPGLTTAETRRYEELTAAVGQGELLSAAGNAGAAGRVAELRAKLEQLDKLRVATQNRAWKSKHRPEELFKEARAYEAEAVKVRAQIRELEQAQSPTSAPRGTGDGWFGEASPGRELTGGELGETPPRPPAPEDNPRHSVFDAVPMELPEAVRMVKALLGVYPKIREQLRALRGQAAGVFKHRDATAKGAMELRADLFQLLTPEEKAGLKQEAANYAEAMGGTEREKRKLAAERYAFLLNEATERAKTRNPIQAMKVIWHEIGHVVDWLPEHVIRGRGNILGRFASLKNYLKHVLPLDPTQPAGPPVSAAEKAKLMKAATDQLRAEMGPIREIVRTIITEEPEWKMTGITPQDVINILGESAGKDTPELTRWFAEQDSKVKADVLRKAMRGLLDERLAALGKREQIGTRRVERTVREKVGREPTPAEIKSRFAELLRREIEARNRAELKTIKAELEPLIAWWRGTDTMEPYFKPAEEMYAEAFSVFANNPAALEKRAPTYAKLLWNYLDRKPEVKRLYDDIQAQIKAGEIMPERVKALYEMWDADDARSLGQAREALRLKRRDVLDNVVYHIDRRFGPVYRAARGTPLEGKVKEAVGNFLYRMAEHERYLGAINEQVGKLLVKDNLDWSHDLGEYLFHRRVVHERSQIANPLGWTPKNSLERLAEMERQLGPQRWATLVEAGRRFQALRQAHVVDEVNAAQMFTPELAEVLNQRSDYATFAAIKDVPDHGLQKIMEGRYGPSVTAHIYRQIGNLGEIKNPATATVLKGLSLISAAARNTMKREVVNLLRTAHPEEILPARERWNGRAREAIIEDNHPTIGTIVYLDQGKTRAFYVRKVIADAVNGAGLWDNVLYSALVKASGWQKAIFTQLNYAFWPVNFVRDSVGWWLQMPGVSAPVAWLRHLPAALKAARQSVTHAQYNPHADAVLRRRMVISQGDPRGVWSAADNEFEARLASYGMNPAQWDAQAGKVHGLVKAWNAYRELGQTIERVNKISGMLYLDEKFPKMPEWQKREIVRERSGSPNFLERGASNPAVDLVFLFYNPWKEGVRSLVRSARANPVSFGSKVATAVAMPTILQAAAVNGWLGGERQEQYNSIPDYDLTNYLCVPLGWVDRAQHKVAYLRLPLWEPARIAHGTMFQLLTARGQGITSHAGGQLPGLNPLFKIAGMWAQYALGHNPADTQRGVNVLTDKQYAAGGGQAIAQLLKQSWNDAGGSIVHRFRNLNLEASPQSDAEKLLDVPLVSNALGRWVKVSDRGLVDQARKLSGDVAQHRAQVQLGVDEILRRMTTGGAWSLALAAVQTGSSDALAGSLALAQLSPAEKLLLRDPYALEYFQRKFTDTVASKASVNARLWENAKSNEERAALLKAGLFRPPHQN